MTVTDKRLRIHRNKSLHRDKQECLDKLTLKHKTVIQAFIEYASSSCCDVRSRCAESHWRVMLLRIHKLVSSSRSPVFCLSSIHHSLLISTQYLILKKKHCSEEDNLYPQQHIAFNYQFLMALLNNVCRVNC